MRKVKEVSFKEAFAAARSFGMKEFTWKGKKYHTRTKDEETKAKKATVKKAVDKLPSTKSKVEAARRKNVVSNSGGSGSSVVDNKRKRDTAKPKASTKKYTPFKERVAAAGKIIDARKDKPKATKTKKTVTKPKRRTNRSR